MNPDGMSYILCTISRLRGEIRKHLRLAGPFFYSHYNRHLLIVIKPWLAIGRFMEELGTLARPRCSANFSFATSLSELKNKETWKQGRNSWRSRKARKNRSKSLKLNPSSCQPKFYSNLLLIYQLRRAFLP